MITFDHTVSGRVIASIMILSGCLSASERTAIPTETSSGYNFKDYLGAYEFHSEEAVAPNATTILRVLKYSRAAAGGRSDVIVILQEHADGSFSERYVGSPLQQGVTPSFSRLDVIETTADRCVLTMSWTFPGNGAIPMVEVFSLQGGELRKLRSLIGERDLSGTVVWSEVSLR